MRLLALGDRNPDFLTHREIDSTLKLLPADVGCGWVATDDRRARELAGYDGVWLLPGTPYRDDEAAYAAIGHCLDTGTPFLGTCGGFQYAAVALARARLGLAGAGHAESDPDASQHVIVALQCTLYGERRTVTPVPGTRLASICGETPFDGFHYCGYGLDEHFASRLQDAASPSRRTRRMPSPEALEAGDIVLPRDRVPAPGRQQPERRAASGPVRLATDGSRRAAAAGRQPQDGSRSTPRKT